jgi:hypothetical protein
MTVNRYIFVFAGMFIMLSWPWALKAARCL